MSDPIQRPTPEHADWARENRLYEIRREAQEKGSVQAIGIRPPGAPFPHATPRTGYYGVPLLKQPAWKWEIPLYFFVGGAAGAAAIVGTAARWLGNDEALSRDCRYLAAGGGIVSGALLISDLGRPARFLGMLRVFKRQSPMSVGAWTLAAFGTFAGAAAFAEFMRQNFPSVPVKMLGDGCGALSGVLGLPLVTYTGVLIGATAIPVWNETVHTLPIHFGMSGMNAAVSMMELMGHENRALNTLGLGASALETLEGFNLETCGHRALRPLKYGRNGLITRLGGALSGPIPLVLRVAAGFASKPNARRLRKLAAAASVAGSLLTRVGWLRAGSISAKDWKLPLQPEKPAPCKLPV
jgi:formate-dependent nitrite reductase membrane component NrfD